MTVEMEICGRNDDPFCRAIVRGPRYAWCDCGSGLLLCCGGDHVIMWGGGFDATGIVTSAHGIHSLGWFIRFVVRFMVALGCIPHNSKSTTILNLLHLACRNGSVVPISVQGLEVGDRTQQISGCPGVFYAGTGRPRTLLAFFLWAGWVGVLLRHLPNGRVGVHFGFLLGPGGWASRFCRRKPGGRGRAPGHARPCRRS